MALLAFVALSALTIGVLSGLLGIGGGIVMAPVLLYLPPLLGLGSFEMSQVAGLTITLGVFAGLSGAVRHRKRGYVNKRLVWWMGTSVALSALAGSVVSAWMSNQLLMVIFAVMAIVAAGLMLLPKPQEDPDPDADACVFSVRLAVGISVLIGLLGGIVGQGGSFILIPLMLHALKLPTRVVIGSNLAIVLLASLAAFVGKLGTTQVPLTAAVAVALGAVPGAQLGALLSERTRPKWLHRSLAVVVALAAAGIAVDAFS